MRTAALWMSMSSILFCGAIFGFFYAWVCSTMWGLDAADPRLAIGAMKAMNASVRNAAFFPAFFLTPAVCLLAAALSRGAGSHAASLYLAAAGLLYAVAGIGLTLIVNVPMNEALALIEVPSDIAEAQSVWHAYSPSWQVWNLVRTIASGLALLLAALGLAAQVNNGMKIADAG